MVIIHLVEDEAEHLCEKTLYTSRVLTWVLLVIDHEVHCLIHQVIDEILLYVIIQLHEAVHY